MKKKFTYGPNDVVVIWARLVMCCRGGSRGTCGCGVVARGGGGGVVVECGGGGGGGGG
jgi:hypothetical protein